MSFAALAASFDVAVAAKPLDGVDVSLRMTSRTVGTPIAEILAPGAAETEALAAFAAGARVIEISGIAAALRASIVLDLARSRLPEDAAFNVAQLTIPLPSARAAAESVLDEVRGSADARWTLAADLSQEQVSQLGVTRPLTMVTLSTPLDEPGESFARAIFQDWGDDLVLALPASAPPQSVAPALDRLRAVAESSGCTLCIRVANGAPAPLLAALSASAACGMPVWIDGVTRAQPALARGASLISGPSPASLWAELTTSLRASGARRTSDLVLFGVPPDDAMQAAAEQQYGKATWLVSPVKNAVLALKRLTEARGGSLDTPLARESLANPPKECCLYQADEPDLKEAATGWTYDLWVRETMRRRLPVG